MNKFFFSGSTEAKLDAKNRFVLPQTMRYGLVEQGELELTICLGLGGCLAVYKRSEIQKIIEKFQENLHLAKYQKFFTLFFSTMHQTTCDSIGRIHLPNHLKKIAMIDRDIVIAGVLGKIEIWPKDVYERNMTNLLEGNDPEIDLKKMTEEVFALLHEKKDSSHGS